MLCSAKNAGRMWSVVASSATAFAPFSQNSAVWRCAGSGSGQAQPWQSKPSTWLSLSSVRAVRVTPMLSMARFMEIATASMPAAARLGWPTSTSRSSMSASGDLRRKDMGTEYPHSPTAIKSGAVPRSHSRSRSSAASSSSSASPL